MINNFKLKTLNDNDIENLKHLNPYWEKQLNKMITKLNRWLLKFSKNESQFGIKRIYTFEKYKELFQETINYKNFLNQKYKLIKSSVRTLNKFSKLIFDYVSTIGVLKSIEIMISYFETIDKKDVGDKKKLAFDLLNNQIEEYFNIYKATVISIHNQDEYLELTFKKLLRPDKMIIDINPILTLAGNYSKMLFKKKKITEEEFLNTAIESIELVAMVSGMAYFYQRFTSNIL